MTFGIEQGTVFCLLGTNGAGKTTTFKILTGDIRATKGKASIRGLTLPQDLSMIRELVGYCPQFDSLCDKLTALEHLQLYCDLKGIEEKYQSKLIENMLEKLNLTKYRNVRSELYSGGNKRKLSVAIALIGQPPIVFLDEPSAGMDPEARRFMWNFISEITQKRSHSSIILTTHSMEEAQALSNKVAIMVEGRIKTIGTIQRLKEKYGKGFEVEIKVMLPREEAIVDKRNQYLTLINKKSDDMYNMKDIETILTTPDLCWLLDEIKLKRKGSAISQRLEIAKQVEDKLFIEWVEIQLMIKQIQKNLENRFESKLIESFQTYVKFNILEKYKLSEIFGFMEENSAQMKIANFSVREISLEQIFIQFAENIVHEDE